MSENGNRPVLSMRKAGKIVRKLKLSDNCLLLVKKESEIGNHIEEIARTIEKTDLKNIIIILVDDIDMDVRAISEESMNEQGWWRVETLSKKVLRRINGTETNEDEISESE